MTRNSNAPKFFLSLAMVGLLVMGTLATTDAHLSTTTKANTAIGPKPAPNLGSRFQSECGVAVPPALCGLFEIIDGDADDSPTLPGDDWNTVNLLPIATNIAPMIAHTGLLRDPAPLSIFSQAGSRDTNDISEWRHTNGNVSDRYDITNAYAAAYLTSTNHLVFVFGAERLDNTGDAAISFWLFQNKVVAAADGTFVDGNGNPAHHAPGDILIQVGYSNGGGTNTVRVLKWVGSTTGPCPTPCESCPAPDSIDPKSNGNLCDITLGAGTRMIESPGTAATNGFPITVPWLYVPKSGPVGIVPQGAFFEGGVDVSLVGPNAGFLCDPTFMVETRSTSSVDSLLQDFVLSSFRPAVSFQPVQSICQETPVTLPISISGGTPPYKLDVAAPPDFLRSL